MTIKDLRKNGQEFSVTCIRVVHRLRKIENYDPYNSGAKSNGMVTEWVGRNNWGNAVAFGYTKKECVEDAKRYCALKDSQ